MHDKMNTMSPPSTPRAALCISCWGTTRATLTPNHYNTHVLTVEHHGEASSSTRYSGGMYALLPMHTINSRCCNGSTLTRNSSRILSSLLPPLTTSFTVISFRVRVPVLSAQITVAQPNASTAGSRFTIAFLRKSHSGKSAGCP